MDIRMGAGERIPAVLTCTTRPRLSAGTQQALAEPEREPLLADAEWAVEHEGPRQHIAPDGVVEAGAKDRMAVKWEERHEEKLARSDRRSVGPKECVLGMVREVTSYAIHHGAIL
jgi:hypothetical protein